MAELPRCAVAALAFAISSGCTASRYAGIDMRPHGAPVDVQALARAARSGDKQAQLDLGILLEEGRGLPVDRRRALALYEAAAKKSGGFIMLYVPNAGGQGHGAVQPYDLGPPQPGLAEAEERRRKLLAKGLVPAR